MAKQDFSDVSKKKRVVLFGGSFNPPHEGHLHIAHKAYESLHCDAVWMMVAPRNPFKDPSVYADLKHRKKMSELMTDHLPWLQVTDIEQSFIKQGEDFIETADTLRLLRQNYPDHEFVWMMGSDNVLDFHEWGGWEDMVENHLIMVMNRTQSESELQAVKNAKAIKQAKAKVHVHDDAVDFTDHRGFYIVESPVVELSSTMIRENVKKACPNIIGLNEDVADYIRDQKLYDYGGIAPSGKAAPKGQPPKPSV